MNVHLRYFATLREQRGCAEESHETTAATAQHLYDELRETHNFSLEPAQLKIVINEEFAEWTAPLHDGDDIAFIPPVAGG